MTWKKSDGKWPSYKNGNTVEGGNAFPTATSHTVTGLEEGTGYSVRVRARYFHSNDNLTESGPWSDPPVEITVSSTPSKDGEGGSSEGRSTNPPGKPTGLITAASHDTVLLSWTDPGDDTITGYQILRGPDADNLAVLADNTGSTSLSYTDETASAETSYAYAVKARNAGGLGPRSEAVTVTTLAPQAEDEPPVAEQTGTVVDICSRTYEVQRAILDSINSNRIGGTHATCSTTTDTELANITAVLSRGYSATSFNPADLAGLNGLQQFNISDDETQRTLTTLPARAFRHVAGTIRTINLSYSNLSSVHVDAFDGLTALYQLALDSSFTTLPEDVFDDLPALTLIRLGSDSFTTVPADLFDDIPSLSILFLSVRDASTLPNDLFDGPQELRTLRLRTGVKSSSLPVGLLDQLDLSLLDLGDLGLNDLPEGIFESQTRLSSLSLRCNSLTELPLDRFDPFAATLYSLDIRDNPFTIAPSETAIHAKLTNLRQPSTNFLGLRTGSLGGCRELAGRDADDPAVRVRFLRGGQNPVEGDDVTVKVELFPAPEREVIIPLKATHHDGATDADYSGVPASLTFSATETSKTFTFTVVDDSDDDDGESVLLVFGTLPPLVSAAHRTTRPIYIADDDDPAVTVSFGAASYTVAEGDDVTVTVELSADPEREVTIPITRSNQDGASDADYSGVPASVTFDSGETSKTFTFSATDDTVDDDGESVLLGFGTLPTLVSAGTPATSTVRIADDADPAVTVSFGAASYTVAEGDDVTVTVELSADPEREVTIPITRSNQDGASDADYSGVPASVTFDSGETSKTFTFSATDDSDDDDDGESVLLSFGTLPTLVSAGTPATSTVRIADDDDPAVTVSFGAASYTVAEGDDVTVTVELSADPEREVTIPITRSNQDGASDADYSGVPASVTFDSGETSKTFTFSATDDSDDDDDGESVLLGFGTLPTLVSAGSTATSTVRIADDDDPAVTVSFGAAAYTVVEGSSVSVEVTLSAAPGRTVEIPITRQHRDGATRDDYSGVPTHLRFGETETSKTIRFRAVDDSVDDDDESVRLSFFSTPVGVSEGSPDETTVSITDNDVAGVTVSPTTVTVVEGGTATYQVRLNTEPTGAVTVTIDDPTDNTDVTAVTASLSFDSSNWETFQDVTVRAAEDGDAEDETATVTHTVSGYGTVTTADSVTVTVTDNEPAVAVSFGQATYSVAEGGTVTVTVELDVDPERSVTVPITVSNQGGATSGDYSGVPASVTFDSGDTSKTFTITGTDDSIDDDDESIRLGFGTLPTLVSEGSPDETTVSITDNDVAGVTVNPTTVTVAEGGTATYQVRLNTEPTGAVTVTINDPTDNTDVTAVTASLSFDSSNWETFQDVTVRAAEDGDAEDETATVTHTVSGYGTVTTADSVTVTVTDNEPAVAVSFGAASYTVAEGDDVTVTVELDVDPERSVTVPITVSNQGGATSGDYSGVPASVTFSSGDTSKTFTITGTDDSIDDDDESIRLGFGPLPAKVSEGSPDETTVSITDNDDPAVAVSFGAAAYTVAEGDEVTVTVELSADPERSVTVPLTATNQDGATSGDYSGVPASVTFDSGETSKTFTFSATQDTVDDDGESVLLSFGTLPTLVSAGSTATSTVRIADDDDPAVTVSFGQASYTVAEGDDVTVTVELSADPERSVTIPITRSNQGGATDADYSGVPASVTFDSGETSKTFTFSATDDSVDDDDESVLLGFGTLPTLVSAGSTATSTVRIADDDDPAVTVSFGAASYTVAEGGDVTVRVELSADPERSVTVPLTTTNQDDASDADYSGVPASVTFDSGETSKTFTFTATDDSVDDDGESVLLGFGTLPTLVSAGTPATTTVSITDNDVAGVTVSPTTVTVAEGGTATYGVRLNTEPTGAVSVTINDPTDNTDVTAVTASLSFDSSNWETFQDVTVRAAEDGDAEDETATVTHTVSGYGTVTTADSVTVTVTDNEPAVAVSFGAASYTVAEGDDVTVTVELDVDPKRTVVVPITVSNQGGSTSGDYSGVPANVTFSSGDTSKTFTFTATDDSIDDDDESIRLGFGTLPAKVSEGSPDETTVSITDNDVAGVTVSPTTVTVAEGGTATYGVRLNTEPTGAVSVTINDPTDNTDVTAVTASLSFDSSNWETFQNVTVRAAEDGDAEDETATVTHTVSGYGTVTTADSVTVTVTDNEPAVAVSFGAASYTVAEGGTVTVTVELDVDPKRTVVVPITVSNQGGSTSGDYSGVPANVTFSSGDTSKTFTFTATDDSIDDDDESIRLGFGTLPAKVSEGSPDETTVSITDNDVAGVTVSPTTVTVAEGGTATYGVRLNTEPTGAVSVTINDPTDNTDVTAVTASLSFDSSNWETFQDVTVRAAEDGDAEDETATVTHTVSGYGTVTTADSVTVTVTDNEPAVAVSFGAASYTVAEGDDVTVTVELDVDPKRTVVVPITVSNQGGSTSGDYSGVPASVTFSSGDTSKTFTFTATDDSIDDDDESIRLGFGTLPAKVSEGDAGHDDGADRG